MNHRSALPALALVLTGWSSAQTWNLDFGPQGQSTPSPAYAAASYQTGLWAPVDSVGGAQQIPTIHGVPTNLTIHFGGGSGPGAFDAPGTTGDDAALLDEHHDVGPAAFSSTTFVYTLGVGPGTYDVYTYAWNPADPDARTEVSVSPSSDAPLEVGGTWHGIHELGVTYARHRVTGGGFVVIARSTAGSGALNGMQIIAVPGGDPVGSVYCTNAAPNSTAHIAEVAAYGSPLAAANDLTLDVTFVPPNQFGYFLASQTQGFVSMPPGSVGNLCLSGAIGRFVQQLQNSGIEGRMTIEVDLTAIPLSPPHAVVGGETWNFQAWYRDVGPTSNFSTAVEIPFL